MPAASGKDQDLLTRTDVAAVIQRQLDRAAMQLARPRCVDGSNQGYGAALSRLRPIPVSRAVSVCSDSDLFARRCVAITANGQANWCTSTRLGSAASNTAAASASVVIVSHTPCLRPGAGHHAIFGSRLAVAHSAPAMTHHEAAFDHPLRRFLTSIEAALRPARAAAPHAVIQAPASMPDELADLGLMDLDAYVRQRALEQAARPRAC
jgi:hypothetical protein